MSIVMYSVCMEKIIYLKVLNNWILRDMKEEVFFSHYVLTKILFFYRILAVFIFLI